VNNSVKMAKPDQCSCDGGAELGNEIRAVALGANIGWFITGQPQSRGDYNRDGGDSQGLSETSERARR
jgi:hypothetical protein